jgi:hypothetical protein
VGKYLLHLFHPVLYGGIQLKLIAMRTTRDNIALDVTLSGDNLVQAVTVAIKV